MKEHFFSSQCNYFVSHHRSQIVLCFLVHFVSSLFAFLHPVTHLKLISEYRMLVLNKHLTLLFSAEIDVYCKIELAFEVIPTT
jgi:hypothetical protein